MGKYDKALELMLFVSIEDAYSIASKLENEEKRLYSLLSYKNLEFNKSLKKVLLKIKDTYLRNLKSSCDEKTTLHDSLHSSIAKLSAGIIAGTESIIGVKDAGSTLDTLKVKMQNQYSDNNISAKTIAAIDSVKMLESFLTNDDSKVTRDRIKSEYDTYCVKGQNILFDKYVDMTNTVARINAIREMIDAIKIVQKVRSKQSLFTSDAVLNFIKNENQALLIIKSIAEAEE